MSRTPSRRPLIPMLTVPASLVAAAAIVFANPAGEKPSHTDDVEDMTSLAQGLNARTRMHVGRIEYKQDLVRRLVDGELTLAETAAEFLSMNRDVPAIMQVVRSSYPGATDEEKTAMNVVEYVRTMHLPAAREATALARITAEYEALYGHAPARR